MMTGARQRASKTAARASKTATWQTAGVEIQCPHCGQGVEEPKSSSYYWAVEDLEAARERGPMKCRQCGESFNLPRLRK